MVRESVVQRNMIYDTLRKQEPEKESSSLSLLFTIPLAMAILLVSVVYVWGLTKITEIVFYLTSTTNSICKSDGSIVTQLNNVEIFVVKVFTIISITGNIIQFLSRFDR